ncbi:MAG: chemotaxis protein CheD [Lachnospiraceae bacterium]|nr:chemotaxis protein CheD [Lachnospiraceae bacterium]
MADVIRVGMADLNICKAPDSITTLGLGSCVGIVLYDKRNKIAGLAHIMLPDSTQIRNNSNLAKFADTGIDQLIHELKTAGADIKSLTAKIAGGAQMFSFSGSSDLTKVGDRNVEATVQKLETLRIPILASDTGKNYGRTIVFSPETGLLQIKAVGKEISYI